MGFSLVRVDDRVIHGQVVTAWAQSYAMDGIIVVDDTIANDPMMAKVYKAAAPNARTLIFTEEQARIKVPEAAASAKQYFLIARSVDVMERLHRAGLPLADTIILGPASRREGAFMVGNNQSLLPPEIRACDYLTSQGVRLVLQLTPYTKGIPWTEARHKIPQDQLGEKERN